MNPKYILVTQLGAPIADFNSIEKALNAAIEICPSCDDLQDVRAEIREDGDALLDSGLSIYKHKPAQS